MYFILSWSIFKNKIKRESDLPRIAIEVSRILGIEILAIVGKLTKKRFYVARFDDKLLAQIFDLDEESLF